MKISVVIPTYNRSVLLEYTLSSLAKQTIKDFEVIVIDDGGNDNSKAVCESYQDRLTIRYFWQKDDSFRAGKARNVGVMAAEGDYIVFIDSGVLLIEDSLEKHLHLHDCSAYPTVCVGYVYGFEVDNETYRNIREHLNSEDINGTLAMMKKFNAHDIRQAQYDEFGYNIASWPAPFDIFWTCHISVERKELVKAGLFDESFNSWGGEDVDLGIRLFLNQNKFVINKEICSIHWPHEKEVLNNKIESENAAERIHKKYKIWQTSYYGKDLDDEKFSLNKVIYLMGGEN